MTDLATDVQKAIYGRLATSISGASVWQDAPSQTPLPIVIIGDSSFEQRNDKDGAQFEYHEIDIHSITKGTSRLAINALAEQVRETLHDQPLDGGASALISPARLIDSQTNLLVDDEVYSNIQRYAVFAQPA